jgi:ABC-type transporter Mla subunit MlaD
MQALPQYRAQQGSETHAPPELRRLVAEASQALARLDAARLEELALSCQALNRDLDRDLAGGRASCTDARARLASQARQAGRDMAVFARVLEATRNNIQVMNRLRELRAGRLEYSESQARGWLPKESPHGDN